MNESVLQSPNKKSNSRLFKAFSICGNDMLGRLLEGKLSKIIAR